MKNDYIKVQLNEEMEPRYLVVENNRVIRVFINGDWDDTPLRLEEYQHIYELHIGEQIETSQFYKEVGDLYKE